MAISAFDLFSVGIGPSSSHTVGPMRAAHTFARGVRDRRPARAGGPGARRAVRLARCHRPRPRHRSRPSCSGWRARRPRPPTLARADPRLAEVRDTGRLRLDAGHEIAFDVDRDVVLHRRARLPFHPNGMRFTAAWRRRPRARSRCASASYYSVGGGFVARPGRGRRERDRARRTPRCRTRSPPATSCSSGARETGLPISGVMLANELSWRTEAEVRDGPAAPLAGDAGVRRHAAAAPRACCPAASRCSAAPPRLATPAARRAPGRPAGRHGLGHALRAGGQRGERRRRARRHRPHQRRGRHHPGGAALLHALRARRRRRRRGALPAHRGRDRHPLQGERLDLGRRGRLPGRGRLGLLDGRRRPGRGARRHPRPGRERGRDRHGAQPRASPATRSAAWCRSRASSATPWPR